MLNSDKVEAILGILGDDDPDQVMEEVQGRLQARLAAKLVHGAGVAQLRRHRAWVERERLRLQRLTYVVAVETRACGCGAEKGDPCDPAAGLMGTHVARTIGVEAPREALPGIFVSEENVDLVASKILVRDVDAGRAFVDGAPIARGTEIKPGQHALLFRGGQALACETCFEEGALCESCVEEGALCESCVEERNRLTDLCRASNTTEGP